MHFFQKFNTVENDSRETSDDMITGTSRRCASRDLTNSKPLFNNTPQNCPRQLFNF